jgi:hypothetical protein
MADSYSFSIRKQQMNNTTENVYQLNGYENRKEYLDELREEYGKSLVDALISVLPESEDFDGLVTELEDMRDAGMDWIEFNEG